MMNSRPTKKPKNPRGPFKELRLSVERFLQSKVFTILISICAALFFWSVLVASDGSLTREKVFANVAVGVNGENTLRSRGYIVMEDLSELIPGVKMTVEVTQANYNRVSGTSYNPYIDLTKVSAVGENELKVNFSSTLYGPVVSCEPASVTVNVERYITRRVPVVLEVKGELPGFYLDSVRSDPSVLSVSGPASLVSRVSRAVAVIDAASLSGERMSDRTSVDVALQELAGGTIESDLIEITNESILTNSVIVDTELVPMIEVPLDVDMLVTGEPAEGYELAEIVPAQQSIAVAAKEGVLDALTLMTTDQPLDITGAVKDVSGYVRLRKPSGIENSTPYDVAVTAKIREKTIERTISNIAVEIEGLGDGLLASTSRRRQTVQLTGGYSFIANLRESDVHLYVDAGDLAAGEYQLPVQISIDNAKAFTCALSSPQITVKIEEQP